LLRGDLGKSVLNRKPVIENLFDFFPATIELAIFAFTLAVLMGIPLGIYTAIHKDGVGDTIFRFISMIGIAFPIFWVGIVLLLIFYFKLGWLPSGGRVDVELFASQKIKSVTNLLLVDSILARNPAIFWDSLKHLILPAVTLAFGPMARFTRFTRAAMLEVLAMPYIQTARAKGSSESRVIMRHALRNALIPTATLMGIAFGYMLGGSVLVETIFGWPGIGKYAFESITFLDYPAIVGITLLSATVFLMVNLFVDLLYSILDPRIEYS
jgi:ABC-type dipeptide/oligopeptide/nickel transport system permease component